MVQILRHKLNQKMKLKGNDFFTESMTVAYQKNTLLIVLAAARC